MLDRKYIRTHQEEVAQAIAAKGVKVDFDRYLELDVEIRKLQTQREAIQASKRAASGAIAKMAGEEKETAIAAMRSKDSEDDDLRHRLQALEDEFEILEREIPNLPRPDVKRGKDESENEVLREVGEKREFSFQPKEYLTIAESMDLIDMQRAAKVSGARFGYLKGELARLELALVMYAFNTLQPKGFTPVIPPVLVREESMEAMGYLAAHGDEETYHLIRDRLYLVGTSEQSIGPMHQGETLEGAHLPRRYVAFSTCFRRESGSYGKDTKGILRVHQFDKVEMFSFTHPDSSDNEHELLLQLEEQLVQGLKIPYRVIKMVTGDLGIPAARKYDIECWLPGAGEYRETHSTSNCTDFQSRRLNIKYRNGADRGFVHTLNGTAFAVGRTLIAIIENYQQDDGSIEIPSVLQPYVGKQAISPL